VSALRLHERSRPHNTEGYIGALVSLFLRQGFGSVSDDEGRAFIVALALSGFHFLAFASKASRVVNKRQ